MLTRSRHTRMDDQRKDHIDPKIPWYRNRPKQRQTHNVPTYDVENTNCKHKGRDLTLANELRIVLCETKRIQRNWRATLHWSAYPRREQDETEKSSYGLDRLQKGIFYGLAKLDIKLPPNVQNIRWSLKLYGKNYENLVTRIDSKREKLSWSEDPKRYIPKRCTITMTIRNSDDATQPHTQEKHSRIQT